LLDQALDHHALLTARWELTDEVDMLRAVI
jgi:hypothetical protein